MKQKITEFQVISHLDRRTGETYFNAQFYKAGTSEDKPCLCCWSEITRASLYRLERLAKAHNMIADVQCNKFYKTIILYKTATQQSVERTGEQSG